MRRFIVVFAFLSMVLGGVSLAAQEGHPLKGSWLGTWEGNKTHGNDVLLVLTWDGKNITGTINPGTDNMAIKNATLNPEGWVVHLEADGKDKSGAVVTYVIDGKIEGLAFPNRSLIGTWRSQQGKGSFKISRQ